MKQYRIHICMIDLVLRQRITRRLWSVGDLRSCGPQLQAEKCATTSKLPKFESRRFGQISVRIWSYWLLGWSVLCSGFLTTDGRLFGALIRASSAVTATESRVISSNLILCCQTTLPILQTTLLRLRPNRSMLWKEMFISS